MSVRVLEGPRRRRSGTSTRCGRASGRHQPPGDLPDPDPPARDRGAGEGRPGDDAIVEVARSNPTDGTRMVAALASRELGEAVNRKRVQRIMRTHQLLQRSRGSGRRRRPGFFRVTRPDELWHLDMTKVWTAAHGWVYLHAIVDCCTREIAGWSLELRCRDDEAIDVVDAAVTARVCGPGS